jgi:hypothetical protein
LNSSTTEGAPDVLHGLYREAFEDYFNMSAYDAVVAREAEERAELEAIAEEAA